MVIFDIFLCLSDLVSPDIMSCDQMSSDLMLSDMFSDLKSCDLMTSDLMTSDIMSSDLMLSHCLYLLLSETGFQLDSLGSESQRPHLHGWLPPGMRSFNHSFIHAFTWLDCLPSGLESMG